MSTGRRARPSWAAKLYDHEQPTGPQRLGDGVGEFGRGDRDAGVARHHRRRPPCRRRTRRWRTARPRSACPAHARTRKALGSDPELWRVAGVDASAWRRRPRGLRARRDHSEALEQHAGMLRSRRPADELDEACPRLVGSHSRHDVPRLPRTRLRACPRPASRPGEAHGRRRGRTPGGRRTRCPPSPEVNTRHG